MKQHFIIKSGHKQLLLFFAGWGMDEHPFEHLHPMNCDWMICYDYRSLAFDEMLLEGYAHITLVAWSMGVWAASQVMKQRPILLTSQRIAINGTLYPIHATQGIDPTIFEGTLQGLNELTLQKFQRRMCGSLDEYKTFQVNCPQRSVEELKEELVAIREQALFLPPALHVWHKAFIGKNDFIFLPQHQKFSWESLVNVIQEVETAHYQAALFKDIFYQPTEL